jgi:uncharacterized protein
MFTRLLLRLKALLKTQSPKTETKTDNNTTQAFVDYTEEFINFYSGSLRICGTLTRPNIEGKCPAVVLIHGSGPHTRDEIIGPHQVFRLLADYLSRQGFAILRYDKRGVAYSDGHYASATSLDFADDAEAAFNFLNSRPDIDANNIGLLGHSEGGMIAQVVASRLPQTAFVIMLAAPGLPAKDTLAAQIVAFCKAQGLNQEHINHEVRLAKKTYAIIRREPDNKLAAEQILALRKGHPNDEIYRAAMDASVQAMTGPWFRYFLRHNPRRYLRAINCPVLALNGDKDMQVIADENLSSIKDCLSHNPNASIIKLAGLNHIFQTCNTGMPDEYERLPETMAPTVLQIISDWLLRTTSH